MNEVNNVTYLRSAMPGGNLACVKCGCEWFISTGLAFDVDTMSVSAFGYPLTCKECGHQWGGTS